MQTKPVVFKGGDPPLLRTDEDRDNHDPTLIDRRSLTNTGRLTRDAYRSGPSLKQEQLGPSLISRTPVPQTGRTGRTLKQEKPFAN